MLYFKFVIYNEVSKFYIYVPETSSERPLERVKDMKDATLLNHDDLEAYIEAAIDELGMQVDELVIYPMEDEENE